MVQVKPFRGIFYNPKKIKDPALVIAPPYDIISPAQARQYAARHPSNCIRLILGKNDPDKNPSAYRRAAACWQNWRGRKVLISNPRPAIYLLEQRFRISGRPVRRRGMIALVGLEDFSRKTILPHEGTLVGPKRDRLRLLTACQANFDPLFFLFPDGRTGIKKLTGAIWQKKPLIRVRDDRGVVNILWRVDDPGILKAISQRFKSKKMIIADGHHRYETALAYREIVKKLKPGSALARGADFVLAYLIDLEEAGLKILPIHRLVRPAGSWPENKLLARLSEQFTIKEVTLPPRTRKPKQIWYRLERKLALAGQSRPAFILNYGRDFYLLTLKSRQILGKHLGQRKLSPADSLDVRVLQHLVIDRLFKIKPAKAGEASLAYANDGLRALTAVKNREYPLAFLLNPVKIAQVRRITAAGQKMPQKSTFFYPKILSGLVMRSLED